MPPHPCEGARRRLDISAFDCQPRITVPPVEGIHIENFPGTEPQHTALVEFVHDAAAIANATIATALIAHSIKLAAGPRY